MLCSIENKDAPILIALGGTCGSTRVDTSGTNCGGRYDNAEGRIACGNTGGGTVAYGSLGVVRPYVEIWEVAQNHVKREGVAQHVEWHDSV